MTLQHDLNKSEPIQLNVTKQSFCYMSYAVSEKLLKSVSSIKLVYFFKKGTISVILHQQIISKASSEAF